LETPEKTGDGGAGGQKADGDGEKEDYGEEFVLDESEQKDKLMKLRDKFRTYSNSIILFIKVVYLEAGKDDQLAKYEQKTLQQYSRYVLKSHYDDEEDDVSGENIGQNHERVRRENILMEIVRFYGKAKRVYLKKTEGSSNLMTFFENNPDNMIGIFDAAVCTIFGQKDPGSIVVVAEDDEKDKLSLNFGSPGKNKRGSKRISKIGTPSEDAISEKRSVKSANKSEKGFILPEMEKSDKKFTTDYTVALFWSEPKCVLYMKVIEGLLSNCQKARIQLYKYLKNQDNNKNGGKNKNPIRHL
jgi:hypothetical protein